MSDWDERYEKVRALFERAGTEGERSAAEAAMRRMEGAGSSQNEHEHSCYAQGTASGSDGQRSEVRFPLGDHWGARLFVALARKHGLKPYRYKGQRHTTVNLRATNVEATELIDEYNALYGDLRAFFDDTLTQLIKDAMRSDETVDDTVALPSG